MITTQRYHRLRDRADDRTDPNASMIMSVGYGPDQYGKFLRNFGPMNRAGGWRRLNVAVTRARYRVEVVASFDPDGTGARTAPADVVSPGRVVTLRFDGEDEEQEYEITSGSPFNEGAVQLSPFTALGKALAGRPAGSTVDCKENGRRLVVHIHEIHD
ncbi:GreA/GreB family elongation factor [Kitasatospora sp. NPDC089797]|uniref:GreA/GreB family elongation factor n=1 Tax=Kitasatospora sp. NPDC089797 TaxID=3155298 RepID=UPI003413E075